MKLTIDVTKEDIDQGMPGDPLECPIALAIRRTIPNAEVSVSDSGLIIMNHLKYTFWPPSIAREFISQFDDYGPVKPITFEIDLMEI